MPRSIAAYCCAGTHKLSLFVLCRETWKRSVSSFFYRDDGKNENSGRGFKLSY